MIAGIFLGIALAAAAVSAALRKAPSPAYDPHNKNLAAPTAVLDAVKGFIQALASAPTWLALFGGGILLLWLAGNAVPEICRPSSQQERQQN